MKNSAYLYSELKTRQIYFDIATFTAFLASSLFIVGFFAGNIKFWTWTADQWPYGVLGVLITLAVTGFQRTLYSQGATTKEELKENLAAGRKMTWFAFFLSFAFGMMTEVGGGMEREEARMLDKSVSSPVFQSLMDNIGNITGTIGDNPYADRIARAGQIKAAHVLELGRCNRHASKGPKRVERCEVYEQKKIDAQDAKIRSYNQMAAGADSQRGNALTETMAQAKSFERDESNHHPLVKLFKGWFSISPIFASFLLSALIIGVFEFAFHYQGKCLAEIRNQFLEAGYDLSNGKTAPVMTGEGKPVEESATEQAAPAAQPLVTKAPIAQPPITKAPALAVAPMLATATAEPAASKYTPTQSNQRYSAEPATMGRTESISTTPSEMPLAANGIGFLASAEATTQAPEKAPEMSAPEAKALLSTINNGKFDEVFVGVATGNTPTAIGSASKKHGTGAEQVRNTLVCLEYCGLVSAKNDNGQRTVTETVTDEEAEIVMEEIKKIIRGAAA